MSVDNFIGAVKVKRDESIEKLLEAFVEIGKDIESSRAPLAELTDRAIDTVDKLVGGILDVIEEQYGDIITTESDDGDGTVALVTCASDLSTLYFEEVSN